MGEPAPRWWAAGQPQLRAGRRIYAVGDIHGHAGLLRALMTRILADLARFPVAEPELIFLGDYVSRGPASFAVLDYMTGEAHDLPFAVAFLKGNHEDLLLRYLDSGEVRAGIGWLRFGGDAVFRAYGLEAPDMHDEAAVAAGAPRLKAAMPARHLDFLRGLAVSVERDDYLFVHGGIRPGIPLTQQTPHDMVWIRHEFLNHPGLFERFVVHGHTPARLPEVRRNRVNVDTRAYDTGVLTAVVLEGGERRFLSTI